MTRCRSRSTRNSAGSSGDSGFTLLEMLVAVAVLALLAGIVPRSFVFARSILDHSRDWVAARLVAETVLNDDLRRPALQPGAHSGEMDGHRWRAALRRNTALGGMMLEDGRMLLDVHLEVDVSAGRILAIDTLTIGGGNQNE
jgi:prepilin-type N-terminal cleavage/methylation domain-containing protein